MAHPRNQKIRRALITELRRGAEHSLFDKNTRAKFNQTLDQTNQFPKTIARIRKQAITAVAKNDSLQELRKIYAGANEALDERELMALSEDPPERPGFPWVIFSIAILKDALDAVTGSALSIVISALYGVILFVYYLGKLGFAQKKILRIGLKKAFVRMGAGAGADAFPLLGFFPISSIMVIFAHHRDVELVRITLSALEAWQKGELRAVAQEGARIRVRFRGEAPTLSAA